MAAGLMWAGTPQLLRGELSRAEIIQSEIITPGRFVAVDSFGPSRHKARRETAARGGRFTECLVAWLRKQFGEMPEWLKGTDCKSVGYAYVGSNPTLSTTAREPMHRLTGETP